MSFTGGTTETAYQQNHADDSKISQTLGAQVACLAIAYIGVLLRFFARRTARAGIGADDWAAIFALVFYTATSVDGFICLALGAGKHEITLSNPHAFSKSSFAFIILYRPSIAAVKFSVLLLYLRIFPQKSFRLLVHIYAFFVIVYTVIFAFLDIFHCKPIRGAWNPQENPQCLSMDTIWVVGGSLNAITDIAALCLPMPLLWRLHVSKEKRAQLMGVFLLGGFVCVVSIIRVVELGGLSSSEDESYTYATAIIWSTVEVGVGIFCACLPVMRPILIYINIDVPGIPSRKSSSNPNDKASPKSHSRSIMSPSNIGTGHRMKSWHKNPGYGSGGGYHMESISPIEDRAPFAQLETSAIRDSLGGAGLDGEDVEGGPGYWEGKSPRGIHVTSRIDQKVEFEDAVGLPPRQPAGTGTGLGMGIGSGHGEKSEDESV